MRLIDADALGVGRCSRDVLPADYCAGWNGLIRLLEKAPTVDAVPVVHGRWIYEEETLFTLSGYRCSVCRRPRWLSPDVPEAFKYCTNCGAKMDGGDNDAAD